MVNLADKSGVAAPTINNSKNHKAKGGIVDTV
jgi:hypothetical protein